MANRDKMIFPEKDDEYRMDKVIGNVLRFGVLIAGAVVLIGGIYYLIKYSGAIPDYQTFHGEPSYLRTVKGIFDDVAQFNSRGIIQLGFLILIATPVARVAISIFAFARQREWIYVAVTLFVMTALIFSLAGGHL